MNNNSELQDDKSRVQGVQVKNTYELAPCQPTLSQQLSAINSRINRPSFPLTPALSLSFQSPPSLSIPFSQPLSNEAPLPEPTPMEIQNTTENHTFDNNNNGSANTNNNNTSTNSMINTDAQNKQPVRQMYPS